MSSGKDWRAAYRKALSDLHRGQRNRRGRRRKGAGADTFGRLGLRIPPPRDTGTGQEDTDGQA
jgi:hypothetical protein